MKQYTFAKSISLCCFYFCFVREIDRFIILICRYFRDQNFQQNSHFDCFDIYFVFAFFFLFRIYFFTFIAFALTFSTLIMIKQIFELRSMNFFAMSIDRKNEYSFRIEIWRKKENNVTSMSWKKFYFIIHKELARFRTWRSQFTFDIRFSVHICFLNQIFSLYYLFSKHASYMNKQTWNHIEHDLR